MLTHQLANAQPPHRAPGVGVLVDCDSAISAAELVVLGKGLVQRRLLLRDLRVKEVKICDQDQYKDHHSI